VVGDAVHAPVDVERFEQDSLIGVGAVGGILQA
jgi:hypothetical protein